MTPVPGQPATIAGATAKKSVPARSPQLHPPSVLVDDDFLFIGRVHGVDPANRGSMRGQACTAIAKIKDLLAQHGLTLGSVTQARYLVPYGAEKPGFASCAILLQQAFQDPRPRLIQVAPALFPPGAIIQLEIQARRA